jgi:anti-sigma regulatory factor (Ser/Thr protein kinase)/biotin operon repressor
VARVAREFGITKQAVQLHVKALVDSGQLVGTGSRRGRRYSLRETLRRSKTYRISSDLTEDSVWNDLVKSAIDDLGEIDEDICRYGVTEMVNNTLDHSDGSKLAVTVACTTSSISIRIADDGVGIFQKIAGALGLADPRLSLIELSKGKFTTDPSKHTGEGIFFTSRAFDRFYIRSSNLLFHHTSRSDDWLVDVKNSTFTGTRITMSLMIPATRSLQSVFQKYSSGPDDYRFAKTHVPLELATFGDETLVSRSSAKRVLARVDKFDEVMLDFSGIRSIGQGFADEIFRVFALAHPHIRLTPINANEAVTMMIRRAESAKSEYRGA